MKYSAPPPKSLTNLEDAGLLEVIVSVPVEKIALKVSVAAE